MPCSTTSLIRTTTGATLALGSVYAVTLLPGVRPTPGYQPAIDWRLDMTVDGLVIVVLALRTLADRRHRAAWLFMTMGLVAAFAGSTAYFARANGGSGRRDGPGGAAVTAGAGRRLRGRRSR